MWEVETSLPLVSGGEQGASAAAEARRTVKDESEMSTRLPPLGSDAEVEEFVDGDLTNFASVENLAPFPFEFRLKDPSGDLRLRAKPEPR